MSGWLHVGQLGLGGVGKGGGARAGVRAIKATTQIATITTARAAHTHHSVKIVGMDPTLSHMLVSVILNETDME